MTSEASLETGGTFRPDWVSPPGDTIVDLLDERNWTQSELAERLGYSAKHVNLLIKGKVPLSEDAAIRLQSVLGAPVGFWLKREAIYRERAALSDAADRHAGMVGWLSELPVKELMSAGVITKRRIDARSKPELVGELLAFFGVASPAQWTHHYGCMEVAFRRSRSDQSDIGAITAWLRMGERIAEKSEGPAYAPGVLRSKLHAIRALTTSAPHAFEPRLRTLLNEAGVTLVLMPAIPGTRVSGVARWLTPKRALVQLSLYGKSNDRFWFTLFHELAHILLHDRKSVFLDDPGQSGVTEEEREADAWARDALIPPEAASRLHDLPMTRASVRAFARQIDVHPGIVVGRLQHDGRIARSWLNDLKLSFSISTSTHPPTPRATRARS